MEKQDNAVDIITKMISEGKVTSERINDMIAHRRANIMARGGRRERKRHIESEQQVDDGLKFTMEPSFARESNRWRADVEDNGRYFSEIPLAGNGYNQEYVEDSLYYPSELIPAVSTAPLTLQAHNIAQGDVEKQNVINGANQFARQYAAPVMAGTFAAPFIVGGTTTALLNPYVRAAAELYGDVDGVRELVSKNGVRKTIKDIKNHNYWDATKSLAGDVLDIAGGLGTANDIAHAARRGYEQAIRLGDGAKNPEEIMKLLKDKRFYKNMLNDDPLYIQRDESGHLLYPYSGETLAGFGNGHSGDVVDMYMGKTEIPYQKGEMPDELKRYSQATYGRQVPSYILSDDVVDMTSDMFKVYDDGSFSVRYPGGAKQPSYNGRRAYFDDIGPLIDGSKDTVRRDISDYNWRIFDEGLGQRKSVYDPGGYFVNYTRDGDDLVSEANDIWKFNLESAEKRGHTAALEQGAENLLRPLIEKLPLSTEVKDKVANKAADIAVKGIKKVVNTMDKNSNPFHAQMRTRYKDFFKSYEEVKNKAKQVEDIKNLSKAEKDKIYLENILKEEQKLKDLGIKLPDPPAEVVLDNIKNNTDDLVSKFDWGEFENIADPSNIVDNAKNKINVNPIDEAEIKKAIEDTLSKIKTKKVKSQNPSNVVDNDPLVAIGGKLNMFAEGGPKDKTPTRQQILDTAWRNENPDDRGLVSNGVYEPYDDPNGTDLDVGPGLLVGTAIPSKKRYTRKELDDTAYKLGLEGLESIGRSFNEKYGSKEVPAPWDTVSVAPKLLMLDTRYQNGRLPQERWENLYDAVAHGNWSEAVRESRSTYKRNGKTHYDNDRVRRRADTIFPGMFDVTYKNDSAEMPVVTKKKKK